MALLECECKDLGIDGQIKPGCSGNCKPGSSVSSMTGPNSSLPCTCLLPTALVLMMDGSRKRMDELDIGDFVAGFDPGGVPQDQKVTIISKAYTMLVEVTYEGGNIQCSLSHKFVTPDGSTVVADELVPNESQLVTYGNEPVTVLAVDGVPDAIVYCFSCVPDANYVADDIRHHNKIIIDPPGP